MPSRLPRCTAFSLHKSYSVSGSESETPMSIRIPSALIFMSRLFCWQCKCFKVEKDLSSSAAYFKYYVTQPAQQAPEVVSQERMGAREGHTGRVFLSPCVSPSRVPILSCVHYFQAPATQAIHYNKLHQQNVSDGLAHCTDLKGNWRRP